ncbi:hypothetical protein O3P69_020498 [Scylla paramamosain]|uniref:Uncharacterized protein n=1 Tax=Scylla paramamosain TaxID=85552 RepID=A0AAW0TPF8_SCYPA
MLVPAGQSTMPTEDLLVVEDGLASLEDMDIVENPRPASSTQGSQKNTATTDQPSLGRASAPAPTPRQRCHLLFPPGHGKTTSELFSCLVSEGFMGIVMECPGEEGTHAVIIHGVSTHINVNLIEVPAGFHGLKRSMVRQKPRPQLLGVVTGKVPSEVHLLGLGRRRVERYTPEPDLCHHYSRWDHKEWRCQSAPRCRYCACSHKSVQCLDKIKEGTKIPPRWDVGPLTSFSFDQSHLTRCGETLDQDPDAESTRLQSPAAPPAAANVTSSVVETDIPEDNFNISVPFVVTDQLVEESINHPANVPEEVELGKIIREAARKDIFRHASPIIDEALSQVPPGAQLPSIVNLKCAAIYCRIVNVGLHAAYQKPGEVKDYSCYMMALPHLPHEHIPGAFQQMKNRCPPDEHLADLTNYIERSWINHKHCKPESWSTFRRFLRTNNDCEGWHNHLNSELPHDHPNMHILIPLLHQEAEKLERTVELVCQQVVHYHRRRETKLKQAALEKLWGKYSAGELSTFEFLKKCSK